MILKLGKRFLCFFEMSLQKNVKSHVFWILKKTKIRILELCILRWLQAAACCDAPPGRWSQLCATKKIQKTEEKIYRPLWPIFEF